MKLLSKLTIITILLFCSTQSFSQQSLYNRKIDEKLRFKAQMSRLWVDDAIWSRQAILCLTDRLPGTQETLYRLMMNQEEMGRVFTRYYGKSAGNEFCELISSYTSNIISLIRHKANGNSEELVKARKSMNDKIENVSTYLAKINPYWNKDELDYLFKLQLDLFELQLEYRLSGNYTADVENFDRIVTEAYKLSDVLSEGIIQQFSKRFQ